MPPKKPARIALLGRRASGMHPPCERNRHLDYTRQAPCLWLSLFHAVVGVPRALELSDIEDLTRVISVVCADMGKIRSSRSKLCVIGMLYEVFQGRHNLIESFHGRGRRIDASRKVGLRQ